MIRTLLFLGAFAAATPLLSQVPATATDPLQGEAAAGRWTYRQFAGGSEAVFTDAANAPQLILRCTRATRRMTIVRPSMAPSPSLQLWTSSGLVPLAATYDPAAAQLRAELGAFDRTLDALAFSRARFAIANLGGVPLVVPNWPEATRTIEDCRN